MGRQERRLSEDIRTVGTIGAIGAAVVAGAEILPAVTGSDSKDEPKVIRVEQVAQSGDNYTSIADRMASSPSGIVKVSPAELVPFMHEEVNPSAGTLQQPNDGVLQIGEKVVAEIPVDQNK